MKKKAAFVIAAALVLGVVLGAGGYWAWERLRPRPLFDIDPAHITEIRVYGTAARESENGVMAVISERESIEKIAALLNDLTYDNSKVQTEAASGWESRMELYNPNGVSRILFSTSNGHEQDTVTMGYSGNLTHYFTSPGYLWEIAEMCGDR